MSDSNVIDIEEGMPSEVAELICLGCHHRTMCVWPASTPMKVLECGKCGEVGLMISTGQRMDDEY